MSQAGDWFDDEAEFRQLCGDAVSQARGEKAEEFAAEMVIKSKQYGLKTYISDGQMKWLCKMADQVPPQRKTAPIGAVSRSPTANT